MIKIHTIIAGGGAAGLIAAGVALRCGQEVTVLDPFGAECRKLRITGKGRCNLTNNCSAEQLFDNIPTNPRFLRSAFAAFSPTDTMRLFEDLGVKLKTERGGRVFPQSDKSEDICNALRRFAAGAKIIRKPLTDIIVKDGAVCAACCREESLSCDRLIVATGGCSYPTTGATGDGFALAERLGHTVIKPMPSLVPLESRDSACARMQGLALKNVSMRAFENDKLVFSGFGEMLFTHFGISGPLTLSASAHMRSFGNKKYRISLDLKPALSEKELDTRILRDFSQNINRDFINSLDRLLPLKLIPIVVERSGIDERKKVNSITKQERANLCEIIKNFELEITAPRPVTEAIITSGGVSTREINPKTMESKLVRGLYFAGEVIDVDGYTGGFNLQIAWATGAAAGRAPEST